MNMFAPSAADATREQHSKAVNVLDSRTFRRSASQKEFLRMAIACHGILGASADCII
jgi:hypothetical protein